MPHAARVTASRRFAAYVIEAFHAPPETWPGSVAGVSDDQQLGAPLLQ
jgi:hypothetical protein